MKMLVLMIDIQNEYIAAGRDFFISNIQPSLDNAKKILENARANKIPVWHIQHKKSGNYFSADSHLSDLITGFEPIEGEKLFLKNMYSSFSSAEFLQQVTLEKPDQIVILGYGSSMCCLCTIIDGIHRGFRFTLIEDATASRCFSHADGNDMHRSAINIIKQYADVVSTDELILRM